MVRVRHTCTGSSHLSVMLPLGLPGSTRGRRQAASDSGWCRTCAACSGLYCWTPLTADVRLFVTLGMMEEASGGGVKVEPRDFLEQYQASIVPGIRRMLLRPSCLQDLSVMCAGGVSVATSALLLAAISPWLRSLMEAAGEGLCLCLPTITAHQFTSYLDSCLAVIPGNRLEEVMVAHKLLVPSRWSHTQEDYLKVEEGLLNDVNDNRQDDSEGEEEEQKIGDQEDDDTKICPPDIKEAKQKIEPFRCRYDPMCSVAFRSTKVRTEHERMKHAALYVPATCMPPYCLVKGQATTCRQCGFSTDNSPAFLEHLRRHQVEGFQCECTNMPTTMELVSGDNITRDFIVKEKHMRVHHMGWVGCQETWQDVDQELGMECLFICESKKEMEEHSKNHQTEKRGEGRGRKRGEKLVCPDCGKEFPPRAKNGQSGQVEYDKHLFWHKVEAFSCDCPGVPKLTPRLGQVRQRNIDWKVKERHIKVEHMGWHGCIECHISCETPELLAEHVLKHALTFMCDLCGFKADNADKLRWHTKVTHESAMTSCPECGKVLKEAYLRLHIRKVHSAAACEICGVVVKNVKLHMQGQHMADSDKRFHCKECGKGFMCKVTMENHRMNMHIKAQPYQCRYGCENRYNDTSNRSAHERRRHGAVYSK